MPIGAIRFRPLAKALRGFAFALPVIVVTANSSLADPLLTVAGAKTTPVCHTGYLALHDDNLLVPRWVAYTLTGRHTFGCVARSNKFRADDALGKRREFMANIGRAKLIGNRAAAGD